MQNSLLQKHKHINIRPDETLNSPESIFYSVFRLPGPKCLSSIRSSSRIQFNWVSHDADKRIKALLEKKLPSYYSRASHFPINLSTKKAKAVSLSGTKQFTITKQQQSMITTSPSQNPNTRYRTYLCASTPRSFNDRRSI